MKGGAQRELVLACALTTAGGLLVLLAARQRWLPAHGGAAPAGGVTGSHVLPLAHALGVMALAGVVALLAARRWTRFAVGLALAAAGLLVVVVTVPRLDGPVFRWPAVTVLGGLLVLAAGGLSTVRARSWPALGARYDAPATRTRAEADPWAALDRGEDPTVPP